MLLTGREKSVQLVFVYPKFSPTNLGYLADAFQDQKNGQGLAGSKLVHGQLWHKNQYDKCLKGETFTHGNKVKVVFVTSSQKGKRKRCYTGGRTTH